MLPRVLGVDIGGVIIKKINSNSDTSFQNDFLRTPSVEGAIEAIRDVVNSHVFSEIYLVSKCGTDVELLTTRWLESHFFKQCDFNPANVRFCRRREQKAEICQALRVTHFIDDRLEVLGHLKSVKNLFLFQPDTDEVHLFSEHFDRVMQVHSWNELAQKLLL